jgi:hypothetical protein
MLVLQAHSGDASHWQAQFGGQRLGVEVWPEAYGAAS